MQGMQESRVHTLWCARCNSYGAEYRLWCRYESTHLFNGKPGQQLLGGLTLVTLTCKYAKWCIPAGEWGGGVCQSDVHCLCWQLEAKTCCTCIIWALNGTVGVAMHTHTLCWFNYLKNHLQCEMLAAQTTKPQQCIQIQLGTT